MTRTRGKHPMRFKKIVLAFVAAVVLSLPAQGPAFAALCVPLNAQSAAAPVISGTAQVGQTLTTTTGAWTANPSSFTYQWNRAGTPISGATASTYTPVTADAGSTLTVAVTASCGALSAARSPVIVASTGVPVLTTPPAISGTPQVGQTLTASTGVWTNSPTSYTYQWNTSGGSPSTVYLQSLTGTNTGDQGYQFREVIPASSLTATGTVSGSIRVSFSFTTGTMAGAMTAYIGEQGTGNVWNFDGTQVKLTFGGATTLTNINGATTVFSDYVPFTLNASKALVIAMLYSGTTINLGAIAAALINVYYSNAAIDPSATAPAGLLTQAGTAITVGEVDFRSGTGGSSAITGATSQTYIPVAANVGNTLTVSVIAANTSGSSAPVTSAATSAVIPAAAPGIPVNTTLPAITGLAQVGQVETASSGSWTNSPTNFLYQWASSGAVPKFSVSGGQIIAPNGQPFIGRGIKVGVAELSTLLTPPSTTPLTTYFPGLNIVQMYYNNSPGNIDMPFATLQTYINALTAKGIVVVLQDNTDVTGPVLSGAALTASVNKIASYATAYINNPYFWTITQNEPQLYNGPGSSYNLAPITAMQVAFYNGVRATGSNNIVVLSTPGNNLDVVITSAVAANFAGMANVIWDTHFYNTTAGDSTSLATNLSFVATLVSKYGSVTSANGNIPVSTLEYGDSADAVDIDPGWTEVVQAVNTAPNIVGTAAFTWGGVEDPGPGDVLGTPSGGLTAFGRLVASYIAAGPSPPFPPTGSGPIPGATAQTYVPVTGDVGSTLTVNVTATNSSGSSSATSLPTAAVIAGEPVAPFMEPEIGRIRRRP
jgi:hypothetical protein